MQACTGCHLLNGEGRQSPWAALRGDHSTRESSGTNLVQILTQGSHSESSQGAMLMHSFTGSYSNEELAAIGNFVIGQFGLSQGMITPEQVRAQSASAAR